MKKTVLFLFVALQVFTASAQYALYKKATYSPGIGQSDSDIKTLFGSDHSTGFFIAADFESLDVFEQHQWGFGGRMAFVSDHIISWGFMGYVFGEEEHYSSLHAKDYRLHGAYGGMVFEATILPKLPIHITFPVNLGVGVVSYTPDYYGDNWKNWMDDPTNDTYDSDGYFIAEPMAQLEVNVFRFLRLGIGAGYRFTSNLDIPELAPDKLENFIGRFSVKLGAF